MAVIDRIQKHGERAEGTNFRVAVADQTIKWQLDDDRTNLGMIVRVERELVAWWRCIYVDANKSSGIK